MVIRSTSLIPEMKEGEIKRKRREREERGSYGREVERVRELWKGERGSYGREGERAMGGGERSVIIYISQ